MMFIVGMSCPSLLVVVVCGGMNYLLRMRRETKEEEPVLAGFSTNGDVRTALDSRPRAWVFNWVSAAMVRSIILLRKCRLVGPPRRSRTGALFASELSVDEANW